MDIIHWRKIIGGPAVVLSLLAAMLFPRQAAAQWENVWACGYLAGLDFSTTPPVPYQTAFEGYGEASASVCNASGELLFYTEGSRVWDRNHQLMPNGAALLSISEEVATSSSAQGTMIIPVPNAPHLYYILSLTSRECGVNYGRLYYSIVDMTLNNGNGDVVAGQNGILVDTGLTERMTGVAGKDCNIWVLSLSRNNEVKAYELSGDGIAAAVTTPLEQASAGMDETGKIAVSPDGGHIAVTYMAGGTKPAKLGNFDIITGMVSSWFSIGDTVESYAACFSPDNSKLYIGYRSGGSICQYDISPANEADISATKTVVATTGTSLYDIKRGPDQKIYYNSPTHLGVIHQPNLAGTACNNEPQYIYFDPLVYYPMGLTIGLPNVVPVISRYADTVTGSYSDTLCFAAGQLELPDSAINVIWSNGSTEPSLTVAASGQYWAQYNLPWSQQCTLHTDTFHITYIAALEQQLVITPSCYNDANGAAAVIDGNLTYSYNWRDQAGTVLSETVALAAAPPGNYVLETITPEGCMDQMSFVIPEVHYPVSFTVDTLVCRDEAVPFQNTSDEYYTGFKWLYGNGDSSMLEHSVYHYAASGMYEVIFIAAGDRCADTLKRSVVVDAPGSTYRFGIDRTAICTGEAVLFDISSTGSDSTFAGISWHFGDNSYVHAGLDTLPLHHAYDSPGHFLITLSTHFRACPDSSFTDTLWVYPFPLVDLGPDTSLCLDGQAISLQNLQALPDPPYTCLWNTGDTTGSIKVLQPATYWLRVSATPAGCTTADELIVTKDCYIDIPNAFTPNSDGDNDYFFPRVLLGKNVTQFDMQVFNRWGQVIFETHRIDGRGWDGKFNGKEQPIGVYVYLIRVDYDNRREERYQGNVTLVR